MIYLLDVNALIALMDSEHVFHAAAHRWFAEVDQWATCPFTEAGLVRILGGARYPGGPGSPAIAAEMLRRWTERRGHRFWADEVSLIDDRRIDATSLLKSEQVTDTYLLALAAHHGGRLATFDRRISTAAVKGGREALHLIPV